MTNAPEAPRYPVWRYHPTEPAVIVNNEAEDTALGKGWVDFVTFHKPDNDLPERPGRPDRPDHELPEVDRPEVDPEPPDRPEVNPDPPAPDRPRPKKKGA